MKSAIYEGRVTHRRRAPSTHAFSYPLYMLYLDLDELPSLGSSWFGYERARPLSFRRSDYLGDPEQPLADAVWSRVEETFGSVERGAVRLLTHVRSFGYVFNPVSFYYCFDPADRLTAVVAEITNTPWGERHAYVVDAGESCFEKAFHVSPFFGMNQRYRWTFTPPGDRLAVVMHNHENADRVFSAGLSLARRPFDTPHLVKTSLRHPAMGLAVHTLIYWQAFRLWMKRTPFFPHPTRNEERRSDGESPRALAPREDRTVPPLAR